MKTGAIILASTLAATAAACTKPDGRTVQRVAESGGAERTREADNTGLNERDRRDTTTPMDQGSSAAETDITASIRKGIMADEKLSFMGKNVKVITVGDKVTLRGPVESAQARVAIAALASRTAGVREVDNQLEVKN